MYVFANTYIYTNTHEQRDCGQLSSSQVEKKCRYTYVYMYISIYMFMYMYTSTYMYIQIHKNREIVDNYPAVKSKEM